MKRFGQRATLKPECVEEYIQLHAAAWPGVLETITACHMQNYSIYIQGTELFAYFEYVGNDFDADMASMAADPITQEWWRHTKPCFARHEQEIYYVDMEEIFHHD
jgi:L-rhamnose mutarotase